MGIGAYRHFVTLEHPAVVLDPDTWYCALQSAATQVVDGQAAYFVRGRYHPGLTLETQIHFEGRTFQVQGITDLDERHVEVQLLCVEVVARGRAPVGPPVTGAPVITAPPVGGTIVSGETVTLTVVASGTPPLTYQWRKDGAAIAGATQQFYVTGPVTVTTVYTVTVTNDYGTVTSPAATVAIPITYQSQVVADGASNYWPLDDPSGTTARNLVMANPGTISGGVTLNQPGVGTSQCMMFNGSTGWIQTGATADLVVPLTIEAWVKSTSNADQCVFEPTTNWCLFGINLSKPRTYIFQTTVNDIAGTRNVADGAWHHIVWVLSGGTNVAIYVDGVADTVPVLSEVVTGFSGFKLDIGAHVSGTHWFTGSLQDVAVYPRALTPAEILAHYQLRVPPPAYPAGLVSYWSFNSGWNDAVGTNHLTNVNGVTAVAGKLGQAGDFESSSGQCLTCTSNATLQIGNADYTLAVWVRYESAPSPQVLIAKDTDTGREFSLEQTGTAFQFVTFIGADPAVPIVPVVGTWYFIVAWHDATALTLNLQVNNGTVQSLSRPSPPNATNTAFRIGGRQYPGFEQYTDGLIDDVALWRRVLTAEERTALWNGGAGLAYPGA